MDASQRTGRMRTAHSAPPRPRQRDGAGLGARAGHAREHGAERIEGNDAVDVVRPPGAPRLGSLATQAGRRPEAPTIALLRDVTNGLVTKIEQGQAQAPPCTGQGRMRPRLLSTP